MQLNLQNPFPGLRSFDYEESHLFFGREQHINDLLHKLEQNHFVAIVGTSGSGKSSLVRAGLLPAIQNGRMNDDNKDWLIATMKPGNSPILNLAASLMKPHVFATDDTKNDENQLIRMNQLMNDSSLGLVQSVRGLMKPENNLLILLDQFEETFRFTGEGIEHNDEESEKFVNLIIDAVRQRDVPIYVILTIRSDFLGDCVRFEGLPEAINDGHYLVPRLNEKQNKLVITGPVQYANGKISPRLVQLVTNDLGDNPDQLPVLQHALMRTWDNWIETATIGEPMDIRHYEMIGTMKHALSRHADEAYHELKSDQQKNLIANLFKCLTVKSGENRGVRRPTTIHRLMEITGASFEAIKEVLQPFRKLGRTFILPAEDIQVSESTVMDISHESLMRGWDRLKNWVEEETDSAEIYQRLTSGAILHKEGRAALWRDPELQVALDWKTKNKPNKAWAKQYNDQFEDAIRFLAESEDERSAELSRKQQRKRIIQLSIAGFLFIVSVLTIWALFQTKKATDKSKVANSKTVEALNQKQLAEKAKEMALAASKEALDAKSFAELQANIAGEQSKLAKEQKAKAELEASRATSQEREAIRQRQEAQRQEAEAQVQKQLAEQKSQEALLQKEKADISKAEATRLRLVSISQNIAFKSLQEKDDEQLSGLLAKQAYTMAKENGGNLHDYQLYNALLSATQKVDPDFKTISIRENDEIKMIAVKGKSLVNLMSIPSVKNYDVTNHTLINKTSLSGISSTINTSYLSETGEQAAYGTENNHIVAFNLKNPAEPHVLKGHKGLIRSVCFSNDGTMIASGGRDSIVILWKNYTEIKRVKFNSRIRSLSFNTSNSQLYVGTEDGTVSLYNINNDDKKIFSSLSGSRVQCIQSGNKYISIGYSNGAVQVYSSNGSLIRTLNEGGSADNITLDEKNDILITATANKIIHIYQLSDISQKPIEIRCSQSIQSIAVYAGEILYVACADKTISAYPIQTSIFEKKLDAKLKRKFSTEEWNTYIGADVPFNK